MILDNKDVQKLIEIVTVCKNAGLESVILDNEGVRGMSDRGVLLIAQHNIEQFKKTPMGITRMPILFARLNLVTRGDDLPTISLDFKDRDNGDKIVLRLKMKNKKTNVDFKCSDPLLIKAKKTFKEAFIYSFDLDEETVELMAKTSSSMKTDKLNFILEQGKVYFNINDVEGDSLKHLVTDKVLATDPTKDKFMVNMKNDIVVPLFRQALGKNGDINIKISEVRNVLLFNIGSLSMYVVPEI